MTTLLPLTATVAATAQSKSTIYRGVKAGSFPAPVKISARRIAWKAADIQKWIDALKTSSIAVKG